MNGVIKFITVLLFGVFIGVFVLPGYLTSEEVWSFISTATLVVAALLLVAIGGFIAYGLLVTGAKLAIESTSKNDQWDTRKVTAYGQAFNLGAKTAIGRLPVDARAVELDEGWQLPMVESYHLAAPDGNDR